MADEIFAWSVRTGDTGQIDFKVRAASFGDGYQQRLRDGINSKRAKWPITIIGTLTEVQPILDFLDRHAGGKAFQWTSPIGVVGRYVCAGYAPRRGAGAIVTLTATFEEFFGA
ncbi:phage tail protein [Burkholderia sp. MSMB1498]|uniref:phage tail protein n=1 Tax=Burkholderia sp. MSMB1498 TaxID=1637842 RepID=UPI000752873D|nr:phage tail protein [Burkholderia sp. MSMB1498]KVK77806.1 phage tail protein [Burkholderia sp. MSMB1498]